MANEAEIIELLGNAGDPIRWTVADGTTIAIGTILKFADPRTASATSADGDFPAGIASEGKLASNGITSISAYLNGIFDCKDAGAGITAGDMVKINGANLIATADEAGAQGPAEIFGRALETAAASEVIAVRVNL